jgi:hypothetical protein
VTRFNRVLIAAVLLLATVGAVRLHQKPNSISALLPAANCCDIPCPPVCPAKK